MKEEVIAKELLIQEVSRELKEITHHLNQQGNSMHLKTL
jgi:hypothetical protein